MKTITTMTLSTLAVAIAMLAAPTVRAQERYFNAEIGNGQWSAVEPPLAQQSMQQPMIASPEEAKFASSPNFPDCFHYAVVRGDPKGSGSVMLIRMSSGCVVPSHWHSANEQLTFTSGTGQVLMKGEQPHTVSAGTYHYVPANHVHQVTCKDNCTFYRMIDGPTDIHYVDAAGNEIATAAALAAFGENPGTAVAQK
jgi:quercetin dioxygenase-like cupin family protein